MKNLLFMALTVLGLTFSAHADLRINVTEKTFKPVPIAITPFDGETLNLRKLLKNYKRHYE